MQADKDSIITIFLVLPIFTQFILRSAVCHIHDLGKSKTFRKKSHRSLSLFQKVLLIGYAEDCKYYTSQAKKIKNCVLGRYILSNCSCCLLDIIERFSFGGLRFARAIVR